MSNKKMKAFTMVELLVVVAIVVVLAMAGIVGYRSFNKRAYVSNDIDMVYQYNMVLSGNEDLNDRARCMSEALDQIIDAGLQVDTLEPQTEGYHFVYDNANNRMALVNDDLSEVVACDENRPLLVENLKSADNFMVVNNDDDYGVVRDVENNNDLTSPPQEFSCPL